MDMHTCAVLCCVQRHTFSSGGYARIIESLLTHSRSILKYMLNDNGRMSSMDVRRTVLRTKGAWMCSSCSTLRAQVCLHTTCHLVICYAPSRSIHSTRLLTACMYAWCMLSGCVYDVCGEDVDYTMCWSFSMLRPQICVLTECGYDAQ